MINIMPRLIFILGFGCFVAGAIFLAERKLDPNVKCIKSFKRRVRYYIVPFSIIGISLLIMGLSLGVISIIG